MGKSKKTGKKIDINIDLRNKNVRVIQDDSNREETSGGKTIELADNLKDEIKVGKTKATQAETRDSLVGKLPISKLIK